MKEEESLIENFLIFNFCRFSITVSFHTKMEQYSSTMSSLMIICINFCSASNEHLSHLRISQLNQVEYRTNIYSFSNCDGRISFFIRIL